MNGYRLFFSLIDHLGCMRTGMVDIIKPPFPLVEGVLRDIEAVIAEKFDATEVFIHALRQARVREVVFHLDNIGVKIA
jgi:hypothetical protein